MKAVLFTEFGDPGDVVHVDRVEEPVPGPGQVLIEVRAASINPLDVKRIHGWLGEVAFPAVTGFDAAGVVVAVGDDVDDFAVGDEVFGKGSATHAERALLDTAVAKPAQWSWADAGAIGVTGETAVRVLNLLNVVSGSTVLIDGASGGVGTVAVQLAVSRGATVIATASEVNHDYLRSLGATPIRYGDGLAERVAHVAPDGVDAVFDAAGKTAARILAGIAPRPDQVVSIANFDAGDSGIRVSTGNDGDPLAALREIADLAEAGRLQVVIEKEYPYLQAADAFSRSATGHVRGKLVLVP